VAAGGGEQLGSKSLKLFWEPRSCNIALLASEVETKQEQLITIRAATATMSLAIVDFISTSD
jgi:hypothetical protein